MTHAISLVCLSNDFRNVLPRSTLLPLTNRRELDRGRIDHLRAAGDHRRKDRKECALFVGSTRALFDFSFLDDSVLPWIVGAPTGVYHRLPGRRSRIANDAARFFDSLVVLLRYRAGVGAAT
jgi:hypothetical protein